MSRFIDILLRFLLASFFCVLSRLLRRLSDFCLAGKLIAPILLHNFLNASLHHPEVLFGVYVFGFGLVLQVFYFFDVSLLLLVTFKAVVDAGGRSRGLIQERLKANRMSVDGIWIAAGHHGG